MRALDSIRELLAISVVVLLFAGNILVGKSAATAMPPFTLALLRCVIALAASLLCFGPAAWRAIAVFRHRSLSLFVIGASGVGLFNAFLYAALHTASSTAVAVLEASIPVFTAVVAWLWLHERLGWLGWLGIAVSALGAIVVVSNGAPLDILETLSPGIVIMLGAIAAWVLYAVTARRALVGLPAMATMVPLTLAAVVTLLPLAAIEQLALGGAGSLSLRSAGSALYLGLGPSFIAFILYNRAVLAIGPTGAALGLNALPVVVMAFGYLLFGERISTAQILGTLMVIAGVSAVTLSKKLRQRPARRDRVVAQKRPLRGPSGQDR